MLRAIQKGRNKCKENFNVNGVHDGNIGSKPKLGHSLSMPRRVLRDPSGYSDGNHETYRPPTHIRNHLQAIGANCRQQSIKIREILQADEEDHTSKNCDSRKATNTRGQRREEDTNRRSKLRYSNQNNSHLSLTKPQLYSRSLLLRKETFKELASDCRSMYFIECLYRKSGVATQVALHIHNSMLTFKQFNRAAQLARAKTVNPNISAQRQNRKTIVFDMDETLIHTSEVPIQGYEIKVPFRSFQGRMNHGYVNIRPHAKEILKNLSEHFDVIVFTAGNQCYADPILDHLDPTGCILHRLYRESCTLVSNQLFVKDLRILGRKLENVVLVDNAPHSYLQQLANGIPILNYLKGKDDDQLFRLEGYLMGLLHVSDVRVVNLNLFRLHQYQKFDCHNRLIASLYGK